MKIKFPLIAGLLCLCQSSFSQNSFSLGSISEEKAKDIIYDNFGNFYVAASFAYSITYSDKIISSKGGKDIMVAKFNAKGHLAWVQSIGSTDDDEPSALKLDEHNNLYLVGTFKNTITVNISSASQTQTNKGGKDILLIRMNAFNGDIDWQSSIATDMDDEATSIDFDKADGLVMGGSSINKTTLAKEIFVARVAQYDGTFISKKIIFKTTDADNAVLSTVAIASDNERNIYLATTFAGSVTLLNDKNRSQIKSDGGADMVIMKTDLEGMMIWNGLINGTKNESITGKAVAFFNNNLLVNCFSEGGCKMVVNAVESGVDLSPFTSSLIKINPASGNLIAATELQATNNFGQTKNYLYQPNPYSIYSLTVDNKAATIKKINTQGTLFDDTKMVSFTQDMVEVNGICTNIYTDELVMLFTFKGNSNVFDQSFASTGVTDIGIIKLSLTKNELWRMDERRTAASDDNFSVDFHNNSSQAIINLEYINKAESYVNAAIYDFNGKKIKEVSNEMQGVGLHQAFVSMTEFPYGFYILELNGERKPIFKY